MYYLEIEIESSSFGIGTYRIPTVNLLNDEDPSLSTVVDASIWVQGSAVYALESDNLGTIVIGHSVGTAHIWAKFEANNSEVYGNIEVSVTDDYDWGLSESGSLEVSGDANYAHYSGYNRGVKRPFDSGEKNRMDDAVSSLTASSPSAIILVTERPIGTQGFSLQEFNTVSQTGYGLTYGMNFGNAGEVIDG